MRRGTGSAAIFKDVPDEYVADNCPDRSRAGGTGNHRARSPAARQGRRRRRGVRRRLIGQPVRCDGFGQFSFTSDRGARDDIFSHQPRPDVSRHARAARDHRSDGRGQGRTECAGAPGAGPGDK